VIFCLGNLLKYYLSKKIEFSVSGASLDITKKCRASFKSKTPLTS
jgi:hypothetical protein